MTTPSEDEQKIRGIAADLRIIADDIVRGAGRAESRIAELLHHNAELATALEGVRKQLPTGMQNCTIVFKTCGIGHAWLTAKNWEPIGCPTCRIAELLERNLALSYEVESLTACCADYRDRDAAAIHKAAAAPIPDYVTRAELVDALADAGAAVDGPPLHALAIVIGKLRKS